MSYVANLDSFCRDSLNGRGLNALGVQVLTCEPISIDLFQDPGLVKSLVDVFKKLNQELLSDALEENSIHKLLMHCIDLKYLAKPLVLPTIVKKSNFVDELIWVMASWHFIDACTLPT